MLAALAVASLASGCGRKAPPKPPEFAAPKAIGDLRAANRGDGILLSWGRPSEHADDTPLNNLGHFVVERAPASSAAGFVQIATLEVTDQERFRKTRTFSYLDRQIEVGSDYLYRVIAFTADGYGSQPSNAVRITRQIPAPPTATPPPHARGKVTPAQR